MTRRRRNPLRRLAGVRWAGWSLLGVVLLQLLAGWTVRLIDPPPGYMKLARDLWAREHELAFWPVIVMVAVGPILTGVALWWGRWPTRLAAVAVWPAWVWVMHRLDLLETVGVMLAVFHEYRM